MKKLLEQIATDNHRTFDLFYHTYYDAVFRFAFYFVKEKNASKQIVTDVFFAIWQSRKRLKDIENIEVYLYISVRNEVYRYRKYNSANKFVPLEDISIQIEEQDENTPEERMLIEEAQQILTETINKLPERCRLIFLMAREEGLKTKDIAQILSINESTVRVQMRIAIEKIVANMKPYFPDMSFCFFFMLLVEF